MLVVSYRDGYDDSNRNACGNGKKCLAVVIGGEECRILQCTICAYNRQLCATQDGIGIEV